MRVTQQSEERVARMVAEIDIGGRHPPGIPGKVIYIIPLIWSLFQLWYASPLPFELGVAIFNDTEARSIHLAFAIFLTFLAFPASRRSSNRTLPTLDWVLATFAAFCASYIYLFYEEIAMRSGDPTWLDIGIGFCGMLMLLEATRRALGPPLMIVASVFLFYTFAGPYMPDIIAHKGQSLSKVMSHQWLTTEGVFGIALGVSSSFVFLFVLFGAMLEKAGAGYYFIRTAFALLGHMRGGPAKAAIVASAATGMISGSSIANVATTGTFTIPLMKRVGFPGTKAAAVEVAASTNGQLTPPVMGAAAFLMIEYVGISYIEVIRHAILPALISYIALFYIVHLEAIKAGMEGIPRRTNPSLSQKLMTFSGVIFGISLTGLAVFYLIGAIKQYSGDWSLLIVPIMVVASYILLLKFSTKYPDLNLEDPNASMDELPEIGPTVKAGIYFLLPITVLMWCLIVERFSPGLSAFWATLFMIFIVLTQRPLLAHFRGDQHKDSWSHGWKECIDGLSHGGRNMIGIGVATAAAGIVVGTITLTGIGQVMIEFVEFISGGYLMPALIFTALICIILGMGLPTTANYIVVSSLMAPVVVTIAGDNGLIVPLIAVHMFVFYFGILADDTPPVGLAAFAAAAIARSDPIKTGVQGFLYDIRTAILPFLFIFNPQLLLIGISSIWELTLVIISATLAMLLFAAATQGYWLTRSRLWENLLLLLIAFTLFRPGYWWDRIYPPTVEIGAEQIMAQIEQIPADGSIQLRVDGETLEGDRVEKTVRLQLAEGATPEERLMDAGLELSMGDRVIIDHVTFSSQAQQNGLDFDWEIKSIIQESGRPAKQWIYIPAMILLFCLAVIQRKRAQKES